MATAPKQPTERTAHEDQFYIPAASLPSTRGKVESFLSRYLGGHGRIPIPRTYNR